LGDWWTRFQDVDDDERATMLKADSSPKPRRKRKRRKPGESAAETQPA
ncbi:MAG TPA: polynucleotide adenylyltransferase PcnB, partial [Thiobacillus sp.]|nr:polynucleotide adenylyltransferase PcnB [Thiobacillus sp.]